MGDPKRDPRKHIVSVVYSISVSEEQQPVAGDDAQDAKFWPLDYVLSGELELAGDHMQIIKTGLIYEFHGKNPANCCLALGHASVSIASVK